MLYICSIINKQNVLILLNWTIGSDNGNVVTVECEPESLNPSQLDYWF